MTDRFAGDNIAGKPSSSCRGQTGRSWGKRLIAMMREHARQKELQRQSLAEGQRSLPPSMTEKHREILQLPAQLQFGEPITHYTDADREIEPMSWHPDPKTCASEERYLDSLGHNDKPTVLCYASDFFDCNCHGFTFTNGKVGWLNPNNVQHILDDNGFTKIGTFKDNAELVSCQPQIGNIVIFRKEEGGLIFHSGVISSITDGQIQVTSKRGGRGLYEQGIFTFPSSYGSVIEIYRTDRPGGRFLVTDQSSSSRVAK
jgi:hypothetical protein